MSHARLMKWISIINVIVFFYSNLVLAGGIANTGFVLFGDKLAAGSQAAAVGSVPGVASAGGLLKGLRVMRETGIEKLADIFMPGKRRILEEKGIKCFIDPNDARAQYVFVDGFFARRTPHGEQVDDGLHELLGAEAGLDTEDGFDYLWGNVTEQNAGAINAILGRIDAGWRVDTVGTVINAQRIERQIAGNSGAFMSALAGGDVSALENAINEANLYSGDVDGLRTGDIKTVDDFLGTSEYQQYRERAVRAVLDGAYVPEFFFAGAATRLNRGPMWNVDFWDVAEEFKTKRDGLLKGLQNGDEGAIRANLHDALASLSSAEFAEVMNQLNNLKIEGIKIKNVDSFKKQDVTHKVSSNNDARRVILENLNMAVPITIPIHAVKGIKLGERQLVQYYAFLKDTARQYGKDFEDVISRHRLVLHINSEIEEDVKTDLIRNNFYGFNPDNILIIVQPKLPLFRIDENGSVVPAPTEEKYVYGHGYATEQLVLKNQAYRIDRSGKLYKMGEDVISVLQDNGALYVGTHRINDLTRLLYDAGVKGMTYSVVDIDKLAFGIYQLDSGFNIAVELVDNPTGQKGGLFLRDDAGSFLLEGLNAKNEVIQNRLTGLTNGIKEQGLGGIPYNAFRLVYKISDLKEILSGGLPDSIRTRKTEDGRTYIQLELVTGDITRKRSARAVGIMRKGELIHDFKEPSNLTEGASFIQVQDGKDGFREIAVELLPQLREPQIIQSHLFPRYIHNAIEKRLRELEAGNLVVWTDERIQNILTLGAAFYAGRLTVPSHYVVLGGIAFDEEAVKVIAEVLNKTIPKVAAKQKSPVSSDEVRRVLLFHEKIEKWIAESAPYLVDVLYDEAVARFGDALDNALCGFARNYGYLPRGRFPNLDSQNYKLVELDRKMVLREMFVHNIVENAAFFQDAKGCGRDFSAFLKSFLFKPANLNLDGLYEIIDSFVTELGQRSNRWLHLQFITIDANSLSTGVGSGDRGLPNLSWGRRILPDLDAYDDGIFGTTEGSDPDKRLLGRLGLKGLSVANRASMIGKKIQTGAEYAEFAEMGVSIDKVVIKIGDVLPIEAGRAHAKFNQAVDPKKKEMLEKVLGELAKKLGIGILGVVDAIRFVDNIDADGRIKTVPYALMRTEADGKRVLLLDVDALADENVLTVNLEHELRHSVLGILPNIPSGMEELAAIYMSLKFALANNIEIPGGGKLRQLPEEFAFFTALNVLRELKQKGELKDSDIVAVVVQHMRYTPYYENVLSRENVSDDLWNVLRDEKVDALKGLTDSIENVTKRYQNAVNIFNGIEEAKRTALVDKVREIGRRERETRTQITKVAGVEVSARIAPILKKVKMISSIWSVDTGFVTALRGEGKYVKLSVNVLAAQENKHVVDWLKGLTADQQGAFIFEGAGVEEFLTANGIEGVNIAEIQNKKIDEGNIITLLELEGFDTSKEAPKGSRYYLPYIYSVTGIYLAAQVVSANGKFGEIKDPLVKNTFKATFNLADEEEYNNLFIGKWPKVLIVSEILNELREAIRLTETAA